MASFLRRLPVFALFPAAALAAPQPGQRFDLDEPPAVVAAQPEALDSEVPVRLGIPFVAFPNSESSLLRATVDWLKGQYGEMLDVHPYHEDEMREAVAGGRVDVFISSAGMYREFAGAGAKDLATLADAGRRNPNSSAAGAVVVRREGGGLAALGDLRGKRAACAADSFASGWQPVLYELKKQGISPDGFFSTVTFTGLPMSQAVDRVISGEADAAVISACYFEDLSAAGYPGTEGLRVLEPAGGGDGDCRRTTGPYPGMTLATMPSANPSTMRAITHELFSMPPAGASGAHWSVATDFHETDELLRALGLGPWRHLREWTVSRFISEYRVIIGVLLLAGFGVLVHSVRTEYVVRRRTAQLREAMAAQERMQAEAMENSAQIERLEREGVVQQLSSMLAHELRQPMTAIGLFTRGLISRVKRGEYDQESFLAVLGRIRDLNHQSNSIVEHVRGYARARISREEADISQLVSQAVQAVAESGPRRGAAAVETDIEEGVTIVADALEIRLIVTNLVKNAVEACREVPLPRVKVSLAALAEGPGGAAIRVEDNGPRLSDEALAGLGKPFQSSRPDGLGLGISIVRRIAESYGGRLSYRRAEPCGLVAEATLWNPIRKQ